MSLWTPSGEHRVPRDQGEQDDQAATGSGPAPADPAAEAPSLDDLSPEQRAQAEEMAKQVEAAQQRMLSMPSGSVIAQQVLPLYELAALYLSQEPPRLDDAQAAIDALAAVVERLGNRLGEAETPLRQALNQVQLAYVDVAKKQTETE